jgi:3-hydroxyisobutyrate dehydrogenase-like beta-hydroxyacid dehydrogenase
LSKQKIAFLGTGIMGFHMARNLAEAGFAVTRRSAC